MELVDVYNNRHENLNYTKDKKGLSMGEYRLSCFIWVINSKHEILIQQRTSTTKKFPNMWGTTAGAVKANETSLAAAMRELQEELGLKTTVAEMEFIGSNKRINDYVEVWLCHKDIAITSLKLQATEVQNARWTTIKDFEKMLKEGTAIDSGYNSFIIYYNNFYERHYELINGKPLIVKNKN
jgi:isopentenyldiphosphate isomerase